LKTRLENYSFAAVPRKSVNNSTSQQLAPLFPENGHKNRPPGSGSGSGSGC
jgi:hypothetical protein